MRGEVRGRRGKKEGKWGERRVGEGEGWENKGSNQGQEGGSDKGEGEQEERNGGEGGVRRSGRCERFFGACNAREREKKDIPRFCQTSPKNGIDTGATARLGERNIRKKRETSSSTKRRKGSSFDRQKS